jgi:hypothetical protein
LRRLRQRQLQRAVQIHRRLREDAEDLSSMIRSGYVDSVAPSYEGRPSEGISRCCDRCRISASTFLQMNKCTS